MSVEITEELKDEVRTYWRDTVKDKDAIARTADLFGLREEDVKHILAVRWKEKQNFWTEDRVFRLRAYMAQGMGNMEIAKQLGCKTQAVADFKKRNRDMLPAYGKERKKECEKNFDEIINSVDEGKKKEPLTLGDVKDSEKKSDVEVDSSVKDYNTEERESQVTSDNESEEITSEMYLAIYNDYVRECGKVRDACEIVEDAMILIKTAEYGGDRMSADPEMFEVCCRMYALMLERASELLQKARKILEG